MPWGSKDGKDWEIENAFSAESGVPPEDVLYLDGDGQPAAAFGVGEEGLRVVLSGNMTMDDAGRLGTLTNEDQDVLKSLERGEGYSIT